MSSILHLYAELLLNIKTVNLYASLKTEHTSETKAELSADGEFVSLTHEGETATIRLPTQIEGGGSAALTLPPKPSKDLTLRLQLQEKSTGLLKLSGRSENVVPWSATELKSSAKILCQRCDAVLVSAADDAGDEGVKEWMDLPNENWAEMMDFWHCHKPDEHHLPGHKHDAGHAKGYAASNRLTARSGVGYVDLAYILVSQADCRNVEPASAPEPATAKSAQHLLCSTCKTPVGTVDDRADGWRLWKWSLAVLFGKSGSASNSASASDSASTAKPSKPAASDPNTDSASAATPASDRSPNPASANSSSMPDDVSASRCDDIANMPSSAYKSASNPTASDPVSTANPASAPASQPIRYSTQKWISAQLLSLIENQGVRKFIVAVDEADEALGAGGGESGGEGGDGAGDGAEGRHGEGDAEALSLWVFTPDLWFSSSVGGKGGSGGGGGGGEEKDGKREKRDEQDEQDEEEKPRHDPTRAMKVFWNRVPRASASASTHRSQNQPSTQTPQNQPQSLGQNRGEAQLQGSPLTTTALSTEEVKLPRGAFVALERALEGSGGLLPEGARKFGAAWRVGLLGRFE